MTATRAWKVSLDALALTAARAVKARLASPATAALTAQTVPQATLATRAALARMDVLVRVEAGRHILGGEREMEYH